MCRKHQLWGCSLVTFGLGIFFGIWVESAFFCCCAAIGVIVLGFWTGLKKC